MNRNNLLRIFALLLVLAWLPAGAQQQEEPVVAPPNIPTDDYDRGTPKRSGDGFMAAIDRSDYTRAAEYMDLRNLRGEAEDL